MRELVGELDDLVFDRRAVAGADRLNLPAVHGRAVHVFADDAVRLGSGERDVARHLRVMMGHLLGAKTERRRVRIAGLSFELRPVNCPAVEPRRSSRLQPASAQAQLLQRFAQQNRRRFSGTSGGVLLFAAVNQAIEECSGGDDHGVGGNAAPVAEKNAADGAVLSSQFSVLSV